MVMTRQLRVILLVCMAFALVNGERVKRQSGTVVLFFG